MVRIFCSLREAVWPDGFGNRASEGEATNVSVAQEQAYRKKILSAEFAATCRVALPHILLVNKPCVSRVCSPQGLGFHPLDNSSFGHFEVKICITADVFCRVFWHSQNGKAFFFEDLNKRILHQSAQNFCGRPVLVHFPKILWRQQCNRFLQLALLPRATEINLPLGVTSSAIDRSDSSFCEFTPNSTENVASWNEFSRSTGNQQGLIFLRKPHRKASTIVALPLQSADCFVQGSNRNQHRTQNAFQSVGCDLPVAAR